MTRLVTTTCAIAARSAPVGQFDSYEWVSISGSKVVFIGDYGANRGVFTSGGGPFTKIVQQGDPIPGTEQTLNLIYLPVISGDTAAFYSYTTVTPGIFTGNGGALATVAREYYYPFLNILSEPAISGTTVAFLATYLDGTKTLTGLVTKNGGALASVINEGDILFGSAVTELRFGHYGVDSGGSGTLAFAYALADGRRGVAIATPVPEPSALILSMMAFVAVVFRVKAKRC